MPALPLFRISGTILLLSTLWGGEIPPSLRISVEGYWQSLASNDLERALEYVAGESRGAFIRKPKPIVRSWEVESLEPLAGDRFGVTVRVTGIRPGTGSNEWRMTENWVLENDSWKLLVSDLPSPLKKIWQNQKHPPLAGNLDVLPIEMRIHFISSNQLGTLVIRNGLEEGVQIEKVEIDEPGFAIEEVPALVRAGETRAIRVRYRGQVTRKNQRTRIQLIIGTPSGERQFLLPVTFNYMSEATRAVLGLTIEEAESLTRQQALSLGPSSGRPKNYRETGGNSRLPVAKKPLP